MAAMVTVSALLRLSRAVVINREIVLADGTFLQLLIGRLLGPSSPCRPLTDYTQGALEALPLQTTPELCAVTAALAPLRIQKGQVGIERTLPCPEDIRTLAATDLANEFTAVSCSTDDLLEWHCVSDERHDGGIRLLAPEIPFI